jgi:transcriptional regulator with XRE-family HTH domain
LAFFSKTSEIIDMYSKFWDNIREILKGRKDGQKWLAKVSGVGRTAINNGIGKLSKPESDGRTIKNSPSVDNAYAIAKALKLSVEELVDGEAGEQYLREYIKEKSWAFSPPERIADIVEAANKLSNEQLGYVMGLITTMLDKEEDSGVPPEGKSGKKTG